MMEAGQTESNKKNIDGGATSRLNASLRGLGTSRAYSYAGPDGTQGSSRAGA